MPERARDVEEVVRTWLDAKQAADAEGIRVQKPGDIEGALEQALAAQRPCVVEVISDIDAIAPWGYLGA